MTENRKAEYGKPSDIDSWMKLVKKVSRNFPGLETEQSMEEHKNTVLQFIRNQHALCVKEAGNVVGVLLYSTKHNMICCLAVDPDYRKRGIASLLLAKALDRLDRGKDITVTTFRGNDVKGIAARGLYRKFGFVEGELIEEFGYPNQRFVLPAGRSAELSACRKDTTDGIGDPVPMAGRADRAANGLTLEKKQLWDLRKRRSIA